MSIWLLQNGRIADESLFCFLGEVHQFLQHHGIGVRDLGQWYLQYDLLDAVIVEFVADLVIQFLREKVVLQHDGAPQGSLMAYLILAITINAVSEMFGVKTTSLVAVLSAASLAIGFALQGTLQDLAAAAGIPAIGICRCKNGT